NAGAILAPAIRPTIPNADLEGVEAHEIKSTDRMTPPIVVNDNGDIGKQACHKLSFVPWLQIHPFRYFVLGSLSPHFGRVITSLGPLLGPCGRCGDSVLSDPFQTFGTPTAPVSIALDN